MPRTAEIKMRTTPEIKRSASQVYAHWGISLSDAINAFLVKSVEAGGFPFDLRIEGGVPTRLVEENVLEPARDDQGIMIVPAEWDEGEEDDFYDRGVAR